MDMPFKSPANAIYAALADAVKGTGVDHRAIDPKEVTVSEKKIVCGAGMGTRVFVSVVIDDKRLVGNADFYNE